MSSDALSVRLGIGVGGFRLDADFAVPPGVTVLFGPSGAGKSSLCLAAVRRGARYLSDDILTTNGREVLGVARSIQFDPPNLDAPFPAWLTAAGLDFHTYGHLSDEAANSTRERLLQAGGLERLGLRFRWRQVDQFGPGVGRFDRARRGIDRFAAGIADRNLKISFREVF